MTLASVVIECTTIPLEYKKKKYESPPDTISPKMPFYIKVLNKCINKKIYKQIKKEPMSTQVSFFFINNHGKLLKTVSFAH